MDRYEFLKEWYHKENDRHSALNDSLNIPIGILTAIFAVIFFYVTSFDYSEKNMLLGIFLFCIAGMVLFCIITGYYLFRSYNNLLKGYVYKVLPESAKWNAHFLELKKYYSEQSQHYGDDIDQNAENRLKEDLIIELSKYIDHNLLNNDKKSTYLHKAKQYLFISLIASVVTFIPFGINFFNKAESSQKVEIRGIDSLNQNLKDIIKTTLIMSRDNVIPPPPQPPPPREIKEGELPRPTPPPPPPQRPPNR